MSILFRKAGPRVEERANISLSPYEHLWADVVGGMYSTVDGDSAMRHDAVWSCRTRIAQDVAMCPVDVYREVDDRKIEVVPPQIIAAPSAVVSALDWRYQLIDSWLGWGNAWGLVKSYTPNMLYPTRIELLNPAQVSVTKLPGDRVRFYVDHVEKDLWPLGDLWHKPAFTAPGSMLGMSPVQYHAATITGGLNAQRFGADFFVAGGLPGSILTVDPPPKDATEAQKLKDRLLALTRGNREPLVLPAGTSYQQITVSPTDSQFLDSQRYSVEQVCRVFGEDPVDHGAAVTGGDSLTYANRLDARLARLERRQFWITKVQQTLTDLIPRPQYVRLNTSASLMMTPQQRHELFKLRLDSKTITVNEIRLLDDETPFTDPAFDTPGIPGAAAPAGSPIPEGGDDT